MTSSSIIVENIAYVLLWVGAWNLLDFIIQTYVPRFSIPLWVGMVILGLFILIQLDKKKRH